MEKTKEKLQVFAAEKTLNTAITMDDLNVWFDKNHVLKHIHLSFPENKITCIIGPSGGGKSTLIRSINRINDDADGFKLEGKIGFRGKDIYDKDIDVNFLRTQIGMLFQKPCVFPVSICENVLFGVKPLQRPSKQQRQSIVEENLKAASLWNEVSHRLNDKAISLSIGQQQRLCLARSLAMKPSLLLLDEPTSAIDPVSTKSIEQRMLHLKQKTSIIFVTHNIEQAKRIADRVVFMCEGKIIEQGTKDKVFLNPAKQQTIDYLNTNSCEC